MTFQSLRHALLVSLIILFVQTHYENPQDYDYIRTLGNVVDYIFLSMYQTFE